MEEKIISMYAKGMTTGDIEAHLKELYDLDISDSTISRITDKIMPLVKEWQERPLQEIYAVVYMDAIHYHVRSEGRIVKRAVYIALGIDMDGKKDVLLLLQYCNDGDSWNMPVIFLQENPDNMMYLDYPNLESYKVEAKTENGTPFYRDTFFEEFLGKQHLTEKLSDMEGVWTDYVEYLDSISGATMDIQKQIEVFAQNRDKWATDIDFADEQYKFTLADLDMDGQVELLVSHSGAVSYTHLTLPTT